MRRVLSAAALAACLAVLVPGVPASAEPGTGPGAGPREAQEALATAEALLGGGAGQEAAAAQGSLTLALRDLALGLPDLDGAERARAENLLARPRYASGARAPACNETVCVHSTASGRDAASAADVDETLDLMGRVYAHHVGTLGYRPPEDDGGRGGTEQFDVYLVDVGRASIYGYCAAEDAGNADTAIQTGHCVLDNDYSRAEFPSRTPTENRTVTAAHEFFHAVQYAYDATEDGWLLESTATWVEERFADGIDDNRQYLPNGQLRRPDLPLDELGPSSYGNWIFFEHLAGRYGADVVRRIWDRAAADRGDLRSVPAVARELGARGTDLRPVYALFAGDNTMPGRSAAYPEGSEWGVKAPYARSTTLDRSTRSTGRLEQTLDHLTSRTVAMRSRGLVDGNRLRLFLDGPVGASQPAAYVVAHRRDGTVGRRYVPLDGPSGARTFSVDFASARTDRVTVTLVNGSQREDRRRFALTGTVVR